MSDVWRRVAATVALLCVTACGASDTNEAAVGAGRLAIQRVLTGDDSGFLKAEAPRPFVFPEDHGAHPDYRSEWWYLTCTLAAGDGRRFGAQFTLFRQGLVARPPTANPWRSGQVYLAHLALTDVAAGRHYEHARWARGHPMLAGAESRPFSVWMEDWRLFSTGEEFVPLSLAARADDFALALEVHAGKPWVAQGEAGLSRKGKGEASYYYSFPRLKVSGSLETGGRDVTVQGLGWLDREWSTSVLSPAHRGWDWFGLHLDDGSDVMVFRLRRHDGTRDPFDAGLRVGEDGERTALDRDDFELTVTRTWRDVEGIEWPVAWRLEGLADEPWRIEAVLNDQRMDTTIVYWEGLVDVRDAHGARLGEGYMELTGYTR